MRNLVAALLLTTTLLSPAAAFAQQNEGPAEGTQDVAPAGGLSTQEGVTTEPTKCPDGTEAVLKEGEDQNAPERHYTCPDGSEITVNSGEPEGTVAGGDPTPSMK